MAQPHRGEERGWSIARAQRGATAVFTTGGRVRTVGIKNRTKLVRFFLVTHTPICTLANSRSLYLWM